MSNSDAPFGLGTETARRCLNEGIHAFAVPAPSLAHALATSGEERRLLLGGFLMSAWRCTSPAPEKRPTLPLRARESPQSGTSHGSRAGELESWRAAH
ncbi:hypothetical protein [Streptomyces sp. I05A-00742]|uniref:hypothetical protein n=1 Tax=Streptomyces sp. I05A-00742 TaxID=2732853 RepID=UPI0014889B69|nr:hypothetical protein [Streptomyces sp. I05A-00742]